MTIHGLTNPYVGDRACSRVFAHGFTFRWVKGDRYIAVMQGFCVDVRRYLILRDHLAGEVVHESPRPLVDVIPAPSDEWWDNAALREVAGQWAWLNRARIGAIGHDLVRPRVSARR